MVQIRRLTFSLPSASPISYNRCKNHIPLHLSSEPEHKRLDRQHDTLVRIMNGTIVHAPVINPMQILDVGCGTGVVTCYLGERFPDALVWGIDISPVPTIHDKPNNVTFVQGDFRTLASTDNRFARGSADLVFNRLLICGITDWKGYIETSVNMLKPGGYLEVQEVAWRWYTEGVDVGRNWEWLKAYYAELQAKGLDPYCVGKMEGWMRDAGLESIQTKHFPWPLNNELRRIYEQILPIVLTGQGYNEGKIEAMIEEAVRTTDPERLYKYFCVTLGCKEH